MVSSQGNDGHVRAMFLASGERFEGKLDTRDRIVMFIPEYVV